MRFALPALLVAVLCLPAMAQPGRGGFGGGFPGGPGGPGRPSGEPPANKELEELKATIKALEAKLKAVNEKKEGKVEVVVVKEEKKEERKKDEAKKPEPKKGGGELEFVIVGDGKGKDGVFEMKLVPAKEGEKKREPRKADGDRRPEGDRRSEGDRRGEGERRPEGPPMGGRFGGGAGGFGPPMGGGGFEGGPGGFGGGGFGRGMGGGQPGTPPGFDKLTDDEKKTFRRLMEKMTAGGPDRRSEGGERRSESDPLPVPKFELRPEGGDRKPSVEDRLERLERAIEEIRRGMQGPRGERR